MEVRAQGHDAAGTPALLSQSQPNENTQIFSGTGVFLGAPSRSGTPEGNPAEGDITLSFVNADVRDVAKVILGDYLKLNFEIAADVQGQVTLQTSRPLDRAQLLPVLERALIVNGLALAATGGVYRITTTENARAAAGAVRAATIARAPGYGIEAVPLRYVGAVDLQKLLEPLAPAQGLIQADAARNLLIIEGTAEERQILLDNIALFDSDWLSGMSFALYTPRHTDVQELVRELGQILGGMAGPAGGIVRLVPIARLNAILAISPQRSYLDQLAAWVERLDRPGEGTDKRLFVYRVQNGRAADLAATLLAVLGGQVARTRPQPSPIPGQALLPATEAATAGVSISAIGAVNITADETNNALVILASAQEYSAIQAALQQLDSAPIQVFQEAAIAEVTLTDDLRYGVQYFFDRAQHRVALSNSGSFNIAPALPGLAYVFSEGTDIRIVLDALSEITHVEVISSPKLMVLNNQTATLQVGDRVPIVTQQATSVVTADAAIVNSVQYQDTGVILKVTPRVNRGGIVMMDVAQEVSGVTATTTSTIDSPTIQQRKINTTVAVQDGETVVLGGLISDDSGQSRSGIPLLQEIPLIGNLFRTTGNAVRRTELIVLITPHVIDSIQKARSITEELRRQLPALRPVMDRTP